MGRKNTRKVSDARAAARAGAAWSLGQSIIDPPPRRALDFLDKHMLTWRANYLKVVFLPRRKFPSYDESADKPGMFPMDPKCRVALAGDWGSGTESIGNSNGIFQRPGGWQGDRQAAGRWTADVSVMAGCRTLDG